MFLVSFLALAQVLGLKKIPQETIESKFVVPGAFSSEEEWKKFYQNLWQTYWFSSLELHKEPKKGYYIMAIEEPFLKKLTLEGIDEGKEEDIKKLLKLKKGRFFSATLLQEDLKSIKKYYEALGFFLVNITPHIKKNETDIDLTYKIEEGSKVRIKDITFTGNSFLKTEELLKEIFSEKTDLISSLTRKDQVLEEILKFNESKILLTYATYGFMEAKVVESYKTLSLDKRWVQLHYHVQEGDRFKLKEIVYLDDPEIKALGEIKLNPHDYYNEKLVQEYVDKVVKYYQDKGYAYVNFSRQLVIEKDLYLKLKFNLSKGPVTYFGRIYIEGNSHTRDNIILRELPIEEGTLYKGSALDEGKDNVNRLAFLDPQKFEMTTKPSPLKKDHVDVHLKVKEKGNINVGLGVKFGVENKGTAASLTGEFSTDNLFGRAYFFNLNIDMLTKAFNDEVQEEDTEFLKNISFVFVNPSLNDSGKGLKISANYSGQGFNPSYSYRRFNSFLGTNQSISKHWFYEIGLGYHLIHVKNVFNTSVDVFNEEHQSLYAQFQLAYKKLNNYRYPTKGKTLNLGLDIKGIHDPNQWAEFELSHTYFYPVVEKIVYKHKMTYLQNFSIKGSVPIIHKYTLGGGHSLRGYKPETVGSFVEAYHKKNERMEYFNIGHDASLMMTFELERPLIEDAGLYFALFFDMGNTFKKHLFFKQPTLYYDCGFGLRWLSPFGLIKLDLGFPLFHDVHERDNFHDPKFTKGRAEFNFTVVQSFNTF